MIFSTRIKCGSQRIKSKCYLSGLVLIFLLYSTCSSAQAAIFDVEAKGVYGGFWRDLYKFGPVVIDTVGGDLGLFVSDDFKVGFSFATIVGLLSDDEEDDVFGSISKSSEKYSSVMNALEPTDFSYSTAALKLEYLLYDGSTFGWSTTANYGNGVLGYNPGLVEEEVTAISHTYASLGIAFIIKVTNNIRWAWGVSSRKDFHANDNKRPEGFENFDAVTIYNHLYIVKF